MFSVTCKLFHVEQRILLNKGDYRPGVCDLRPQVASVTMQNTVAVVNLASNAEVFHVEQDHYCLGGDRFS